VVKYGVIGCGVIGNVHARAVINDPGAVLTAVCDIRSERAEAFKQEFGCRSYLDYHELLQDDEIDAVTICLPHGAHRDAFRAAVRRGKHVLCEKPLGIRPEELSDMISLSEEAPVVTAGLFQHRFSPLVQTLHQALLSGTFGEIQGGSLTFSCERDGAYYSDDWHGTWSAEGGGTLINQAIHTIDLACLFLGDALSVSGSVERQWRDDIEVEDTAEARIRFDRGRILSLRAENRAGGGWSPVLTIRGNRGMFTLEGSDRVLSLETESAVLRESVRKAESLIAGEAAGPGKACYGNLHTYAVHDFTDAVENGWEPFLSIREAARANELVLGIYHSAALKTEVPLPLTGYSRPNLPFCAVPAPV